MVMLTEVRYKDDGPSVMRKCAQNLKCIQDEGVFGGSVPSRTIL
jgi:hypothetical protein